jgi:hypothetical protein
MLLRLFKGNNPGVIILITLIFLGVWTSAFLHPASLAAAQTDSSPMPLYGLLSTIAGSNIIVRTAISFAIVVAIVFLLVNFNTTNFFINERTYLPALIYVLAGGLFPEYQSLNPALPASLLLLAAIIRIIDGYRKPDLANNFYDAGLFISAGSLFYANLIWFGILVIIGIALIRNMNISEVFISLLGLLTPYVILFGAYYALGKDLRVLLSLLWQNLLAGIVKYHINKVTIVALIFFLIVIVVSLGYLMTLLNSKKIKSRKTFSLLIWTFLISAAIYILLPSVSVEMVWIAAIPVSYFLTHYFVFIKKKLVPEIFFSGILLMVLVIQFLYFRS